MRYHELMTEAIDTPLPATLEYIAAARKFLIQKWRERAVELGRPEPADLSSACKFASLFAAKVFGGEVRGNFFHQWCQLPDGRHLDLDDDSADVAAMLGGRIPDDVKDYASTMRQRLPKNLYTHVARHMNQRANKASMASIVPRVDQWVREFAALLQNSADDDRIEG